MPMADIYTSPTARRLQEARTRVEQEVAFELQQRQQRFPTVYPDAGSGAELTAVSLANPPNSPNFPHNGGGNVSVSGSVAATPATVAGDVGMGTGVSASAPARDIDSAAPSTTTVHEVRSTVPLPAAYLRELERLQRLRSLANERGVSIEALVHEEETEANPYGEPVAYLPNAHNEVDDEHMSENSGHRSSNRDVYSDSEEDHHRDDRGVCKSQPAQQQREDRGTPHILLTREDHLQTHGNSSGDHGGTNYWEDSNVASRPFFEDPNASCGDHLRPDRSGSPSVAPSGTMEGVSPEAARTIVRGGGTAPSSVGSAFLEPLTGHGALLPSYMPRIVSPTSSQLGHHDDGDGMTLEPGTIARPDGTPLVDLHVQEHSAFQVRRSVPVAQTSVLNSSSAASANSGSVAGRGGPFNGGANYGHNMDTTDAASVYSLGIPITTTSHAARAGGAGAAASARAASRARSALEVSLPGTTDGSGGREQAGCPVIRHALSLSDLEALAAAGPATGTVLTQRSLSEQQRQIVAHRRQLQLDRLRQIEGLRRSMGGSVLPGRAPPPSGKHPRRCACGGYKAMGRGYLEPYCLQRKNDCAMQ